MNKRDLFFASTFRFEAEQKLVPLKKERRNVTMNILMFGCEESILLVLIGTSCECKRHKVVN